MKAAISALSLPPCSMSCRVWRANRQPLLVAVVPLGDARVEVPAVVVEPRGIGDLADLVERLALRARRKPTTTSATCTPVSSM